MKRLIALLILLFVPSSIQATTTVTGAIKNLGTAAVTPGSFVRFWLRGCAGNQPRINGTAVIGPSQGGVFFFDIAADANGNISGTIYSTRDATGTGNGDIECGGSLTAVWYGLQVFVAGKGGPEIPVHAKNGAILDITQVTPITTNPVVTPPTGDSTYLRLDAGNSPVRGNLSINGGLTTTGNDSFKNVNGWRFADQFSGASVSAQINAAVSDCGSYTGNAGNSCMVVIPSTLGCGEGNQASDNVLLWDMRNCSQSQGLRFNLSKTVTSSVRSKIFLQDNYNASTIGLSSGGNSATFYTLGYVDSPNVASGTVEAINGSMSENSLAGNFTGVLVGIEGEGFCNALGSGFTSTDCRGGTFNVRQGNNQSVTNLTSLQAQTAVGSGAGTVNTAVNLKIEPTPTIGTVTNLAIWDQGNAQIDGTTKFTNGPVSIGATVQNGVGLFENNSNLTGANQYGIQSAPVTTSAATSEGSGLVARADTAAASFTQANNIGVHVTTPTVGAGSTITEWDGVRVDAGPTATTKFAIKTVGAEDVQFGGNAILAGHLNQTAGSNFASTCSMSASTSCTFTLNAAYTSTPICITSPITTVSGSVVAGACSVAGTTVTITAAAANSLTWGAIIVGNPK